MPLLHANKLYINYMKQGNTDIAPCVKLPT